MRNIFIIIFFGALLLSGGAFTIPAQPKPQPSSAEDLQKQKKAEQVVIRALRRFGETLNFQDVYRETFIRNPTIQKAEIDALLTDLIDKNTYRQLSGAKLKEAYIEVNNALWLGLILCSKREKYLTNFEAKILRKLTAQQRLLYKRLDKDDDEHFIKSKADFQMLLAMGNIASTYIRQGFTSKIRNALQTQITINSSEIGDTKKEFTSDKPYLLKFGNFYTISVKIGGDWINLSFNVVEEAGKMKIFSVTMIDD